MTNLKRHLIDKTQPLLISKDYMLLQKQMNAILWAELVPFQKSNCIQDLQEQLRSSSLWMQLLLCHCESHNEDSNNRFHWLIMVKET